MVHTVSGMALTPRKRDSLSRYFKDLEESDSASDVDDGETEESSETTEKSRPTQRESARSLNNKTTSVEVVEEDPPVARRTPKVMKPQSTETSQMGGMTSVSKSDSDTDRLPSALECLNSQSKPTFLKLSEKRQVNWDVLERRLENEEDEQPLDYKSNSVPPPSSYEPVTDPGIKVVDSEGRKRKTLADDLEDQMTSTKAFKVQREEDDT